MFSFLPGPFKGIIVGFLLLANIVVCAFVITMIGLISYCVPSKKGKHYLGHIMEAITTFWIDINSLIYLLFYKITWEVQGEGELKPNHWYFIFSNHRSWVDILVLQKTFNHKIPMLKFFIKQELLWGLPMGGFACYVMDFPFMKRYSKAELKKNPALRDKDVETAKIACQKFKKRPTTVMNFLEGTRFTEQKKQERSSPYQNLLRPKAGGVALVINELKEYISEIIDVTLIYNYPDPSFWNFLCGRVTKINVFYKVISLSEDLYGDYYADPAFRKKFQAWINQRWLEKDNLISSNKYEKHNSNCHSQKSFGNCTI